MSPGKRAKETGRELRKILCTTKYWTPSKASGTVHSSRAISLTAYPEAASCPLPCALWHLSGASLLASELQHLPNNLEQKTKESNFELTKYIFYTPSWNMLASLDSYANRTGGVCICICSSIKSCYSKHNKMLLFFQALQYWIRHKYLSILLSQPVFFLSKFHKLLQTLC